MRDTLTWLFYSFILPYIARGCWRNILLLHTLLCLIAPAAAGGIFAVLFFSTVLYLSMSDPVLLIGSCFWQPHFSQVYNVEPPPPSLGKLNASFSLIRGLRLFTMNCLDIAPKYIVFFMAMNFSFLVFRGFHAYPYALQCCGCLPLNK